MTAQSRWDWIQNLYIANHWAEADALTFMSDSEGEGGGPPKKAIWVDFILHEKTFNSQPWLWISMNSLLAHTVAQPTKWRILPKNLNQLVIFVIGLPFTWSRVDKNRAQFQKTNYFKKWSYHKMVLLWVTDLITKTKTKIKMIKW